MKAMKSGPAVWVLAAKAEPTYFLMVFSVDQTPMKAAFARRREALAFMTKHRIVAYRPVKCVPAVKP